MLEHGLLFTFFRGNRLHFLIVFPLVSQSQAEALNYSEERKANYREDFALQGDRIYLYTASQGKKKVQKLPLLISLNEIKCKEVKSQCINNWLIYLSKIVT